MIELTQEQLQVIERETDKPTVVVDPQTGQRYRLIKEEVYRLTCSIVGGGKGQVWDDEADEGLIRKRP